MTTGDSSVSWLEKLRTVLVGPSEASRVGRHFVAPRENWFKRTPAPVTEAYTPPTSPAYQRLFERNRLTLGLFFAMDTYAGDVPDMSQQLALAQRADELDFAALWSRDVPLRDPSFGDLGQIYDPWVWLGLITACTRTITLATGSIVFPLNHPINLAKAAASVDNLSGGRLFMGIASGDRAVEFPAYGLDIDKRGALFRETLLYYERLLGGRFPKIDSPLGHFEKADLVPKPMYGRIPLGITGHCLQDPQWIAAHCDAWIMYSNSPSLQEIVIRTWREAVQRHGGTDFKPFAQPLGIDLSDDPHEEQTPLRSGYRLGRTVLLDLLEQLRATGVNHVALNIKRGRRPAADVIEELGAEVLPHFPTLPVRTPPYEGPVPRMEPSS